MTSEIDRFFDKLDGALDSLTPSGRLGFVLVSTTDHHDRPMRVLHFGLFKVGLACDNSKTFPNADWMERAPKGGWIPFCLPCLRLALENLKE